MDPFISQIIAENRIADLHREAELRRRAASARAGRSRPRQLPAERLFADVRRATAAWIAPRHRVSAGSAPACCPA